MACAETSVIQAGDDVVVPNSINGSIKIQGSREEDVGVFAIDRHVLPKKSIELDKMHKIFWRMSNTHLKIRTFFHHFGGFVSHCQSSKITSLLSVGTVPRE